MDQDNAPTTASVIARIGDTYDCTNTSAITITLPADPPVNGRISIIRAGTGAVTIDGNGETITGETTQILPSQYDAADLVYGSTEWLLT